jgi:hypothetical protein
LRFWITENVCYIFAFVYFYNSCLICSTVTIHILAEQCFSINVIKISRGKCKGLDILEGHQRVKGRGAEGDPRGADRRGRWQGDGKWDLRGVNNRHGVEGQRAPGGRQREVERCFIFKRMFNCRKHL